jgi:two-component system OmpR family response regulator
MSEKKILVVEDDPNLGKLLSDFLGVKGFSVTLRNNGKDGFDAFKEGTYSLLILDVMMPVMDGFTLAKEIRSVDTDIPIVFLTAKSLQEDLLKGFEAGADDYLTKPFTMEVLMARINAVLRRSNVLNDDAAEKTYTIGSLTFEVEKQLLVKGDEQRKLTTKEADLLYLLSKNANKILEREAALKYVWGDDNYFNGRSMDVYITKLRKYLKGEENVQIINVHGKGFKLLLT